MTDGGFNKEKFVGKVDWKLEDKYEIIKEIGSGGFSCCLQVRNKNTGLLYACKELPKKKIIWLWRFNERSKFNDTIGPSQYY